MLRKLYLSRINNDISFVVIASYGAMKRTSYVLITKRQGLVKELILVVLITP